MATASGFGMLSLPDHCLPTDDFLERISSNFHTCVPTSLAFISTLLGSLSILSWLFSQLPQIFKNYELKSSSSLSVTFLIVWCLGDSANLLGALLTKQAAWQVVVAGYYVSVDMALVSQYFWYTHYKPSKEGTLEGEGGHTRRDDDDDNAIVEGLPVSDQSSEVTPVVNGKDKPTPPNQSTRPRRTSSNSHRVNKPRFSSFRSENDNPKSSRSTITRFRQKSPSLAPSPQTIVFVSMLCVVANASPVLTSDSVSSTSSSNREFAGRILSWMSTSLYLGSRIPQIYKNYCRRSTSGLASSLFVAAFFGNLFYSTSILTNPLAWSSYPPYGGRGWAGPEGSDRATWVKLAAPFWLGAAGVLTMDAFIGVQFFMYGEEKKVVEVSDSKGRRRWKKVNGWMKGWIPSPSLSRRDSQEVESERPLLEEERAEGVGYGTA